MQAFAKIMILFFVAFTQKYPQVVKDSQRPSRKLQAQTINTNYTNISYCDYSCPLTEATYLMEKTGICYVVAEISKELDVIASRVTLLNHREH